MSQILKKPQKIACNFCGKSHKNHSAELWEIHQKVIPKGEKIASMRKELEGFEQVPDPLELKRGCQVKYLTLKNNISIGKKVGCTNKIA